MPFEPKRLLPNGGQRAQEDEIQNHRDREELNIFSFSYEYNGMSFSCCSSIVRFIENVLDKGN